MSTVDEESMETWVEDLKAEVERLKAENQSLREQGRAVEATCHRLEVERDRLIEASVFESWKLGTYHADGYRVFEWRLGDKSGTANDRPQAIKEAARAFRLAAGEAKCPT